MHTYFRDGVFSRAFSPFTFVLFFATVILSSVYDPSTARAQSYRESSNDLEPVACQPQEEFYTLRSYPNYDKDGFIFPANPFVLVNGLSLNEAIYAATSGTGSPMYSVVDVTGKYVWEDARVLVRCYQVRFPFPFPFVYSVVVYEYGQVKTIMETGCNYTLRPAPDETGYDPYSDGCDGTTMTTTTSGGDSGNSQVGGGSGNCTEEYIIVEISYDGGATWETFWEGWAMVCE